MHRQHRSEGDERRGVRQSHGNATGMAGAWTKVLPILGIPCAHALARQGAAGHSGWLVLRDRDNYRGSL